MVQLEWVLKVKGSINGGGGSLAFCGSYGIIRLHPQAYKYLHLYENIFYIYIIWEYILSQLKISLKQSNNEK